MKQLRKKLTKAQPKTYVGIAVATVVAGIGVYLTFATLAGGPFSSIEPEGAAGTTTTGNDGTASGGRYLQFGSGPTTPPPVPGGDGIDFPTGATFQQSSVTQYGVTWTFDKAYTVGKYANGDWWVKGPVTLTSITPAANKTSFYNGENINPVKGSWNYDKDVNGTTASNFQAFTYPKTVGAGSSIVKTISRPPTRDYSVHPRTALQTAAVLTVVADNPPKNGATVFRPPFFGTEKTAYYTTDLNMDLWPKLTIPAGLASTSYPTLAQANTRFSRMQMDFGIGNTFSERLHAADNGGVSYGGYIALALNNTILRLMMEEPVSEKSQGIISVIQYGIDLGPMFKAGSYICADINNNCGGHGGGRHLPISLAATMLGSQQLKDIITTKQDSFAESYTLTKANAPVPIYGDLVCTVSQYFGAFQQADPVGAKSCRDPYGYIDGGAYPGAGYQGIVTANWQTDVVLLHLMPGLKANWPQADELMQYMDRAIDFGTWTKPDPQSRAFSLHGNKDNIVSSGYQSKLGDALWKAHGLSNRITTNWAGL